MKYHQKTCLALAAALALELGFTPQISYSADASLGPVHTRAIKHSQPQNLVVNEDAVDQAILQKSPSTPAALRERIFAALRMGAPVLAESYAQQNPEVLSTAERLDVQQRTARRRLQWGQLQAQTQIGPQRFRAVDQLLASPAHALTSQAQALHEVDRIKALSVRARTAEAITLYEDLQRRRVPMPADVLAATADAYLDQRRPEQARDLYLQALRSSPQVREELRWQWQFQLFNAYVDAQEWDAAQRWIDQLARDIPPVLNPGLRGVEVNNEFHAQAQVLAARLRLYANELALSESMLNALLAQAPFHIDARLALADLLLARDQARAAHQKFRSVLVDDPSSMDAAVGIATSALALRDSATAQRYVDVLTQNYPENRAVQRVQREWAASQRPFLSMSTEWGRSPGGGGSRGNRDALTDIKLYSAPMRGRWRVFAHSVHARAVFDDAKLTRQRLGLGGQYLSTDWDASAEIHQKPFSLDEMGLSLHTAWTPNDSWRLGFDIDTQSNQIPLQASSDGIHASAFELNVNYSKNESLKINSHVTKLSFSDTNRRSEVALDWHQRWVSWPIYKLDTQLSLAAQKNTLAQAVYFNPRSQGSVELSASNQWLLWQRNERSLKHRLIWTAGRYRQQGFQTQMGSGFRYEHEWDFGLLRVLKYGASHTRKPFDGKPEKSTGLFLEMNWPL